MPSNRHDDVGVLVIRASVEERGEALLVVRIVEVGVRTPDRTVAVVGDVPAALDVVGAWLQELVGPSAPEATGRGGDRRTP